MTLEFDEDQPPLQQCSEVLAKISEHLKPMALRHLVEVLDIYRRITQGKQGNVYLPMKQYTEILVRFRIIERLVYLRISEPLKIRQRPIQANPQEIAKLEHRSESTFDFGVSLLAKLERYWALDTAKTVCKEAPRAWPGSQWIEREAKRVTLARRQARGKSQQVLADDDDEKKETEKRRGGRYAAARRTG